MLCKRVFFMHSSSCKLEREVKAQLTSMRICTVILQACHFCSHDSRDLAVAMTEEAELTLSAADPPRQVVDRWKGSPNKSEIQERITKTVLSVGHAVLRVDWKEQSKKIRLGLTKLWWRESERFLQWRSLWWCLYRLTG